MVMSEHGNRELGTCATLVLLDVPLNQDIGIGYPISITNPNGTIMHSTHEADLDIRLA